MALRPDVAPLFSVTACTRATRGPVASALPTLLILKAVNTSTWRRQQEGGTRGSGRSEVRGLHACGGTTSRQAQCTAHLGLPVRHSKHTASSQPRLTSSCRSSTIRRASGMVSASTTTPCTEARRACDSAPVLPPLPGCENSVTWNRWGMAARLATTPLMRRVRVLSPHQLVTNPTRMMGPLSVDASANTGGAHSCWAV